MRKYLLFIVVLFLSRITSAGLQTERIYYTTENQSGNQWTYQYEISNLALEEGISEFTIWFELGKYSALQIVSDPLLDPDWNQIVWQPNHILNNNGGFDALTILQPILPNSNVNGFAVSFEWLGTGKPGRQYYEIINPNTYEVISNGYTIPEPCSIALMALGSGILLGYRRRRPPAIGSE
jgi:hypothetical protein